MRHSGFAVIGSILALTSAAAAQPAPAQPAPAQPAPAQPAPAQPAPAQPPPAAAAPPAAEAAPAAAPVEAAPAPAAEPVAPPVIPADAEAEEAPPPGKLAVGKKEEGFWQPGALFQIWFYNSNTGGDDTLSFRIRRSEFRFKGEIVPKLVGYNLMLDVAKILNFAQEDVPVAGQEPAPTTPGTVTVDQPQSNYYSPIQDAWVSFLSEYADVTVGQFKIQVSWEGYNSSSKIVFPERSLVSRYYGDRRDIGVKVEKKLFDDHFFYSFGLYNGSGQNRTDNDDQKDIALRLEGYPIKGVMVGAVGYMGVGERDTEETKDRLEGDVRVELYNALLQAEYIHGWDGPTGGTRTEGHGFYVTGGYTFLDRIQPILRVGYLDQDVEEDANGAQETLQVDGGFNYFLREYEARLALTVGIFDNKLEGQPTQTDVTLLTQVSF